MTTNIHASTVSASKKRRTYSAEFKKGFVAQRFEMQSAPN